nr:MAG TPA: repressor protein [Caudoviricetes sp.]
MSLLDRIKIKAKEQGLTIPGIEEKLSFGKHSMYRWDTNSPSVDKVVSVANLLNVSVDYLITGNDLVTNTTELQSLIQRYNNLSESDKNKVNIFIEIASLKSTEDFYNNENIKNKS